MELLLVSVPSSTSDLAILLLPVHAPPHTAARADHIPVIICSSFSDSDWQRARREALHCGASRFLIQFSNETVTLPEHQWRHLGSIKRRYDRLRSTDEIRQAESPLSLLDLYPPFPLAGLTIHTTPLPSPTEHAGIGQMLHSFFTGQWQQLEQSLTESSSLLQLTALSLCYLRTNRPELAYTASGQALSRLGNQEDKQPDSLSSFLWRLHGWNAARCGITQEADEALRNSYFLQPALPTLLDQADEWLKQGKLPEEAAELFEAWLIEKTFISIRNRLMLYVRLGLHRQALELFSHERDNSHQKGPRLHGRDDSKGPELSSQPSEAAEESEALLQTDDGTDPELLQLYAECLIKTGQIQEAVHFMQNRSEMFWRYNPADLLAARLLEGEAPNTVSYGLGADVLEALLERLIALGLLQHAEALKDRCQDPLLYGKLLFHNGYVMRAAAFLLEGMKQGSLDSPGYRCMAEILYYRGAYEQSAAIFEYLLSQSPEDAALRTALALACLRQSEKLLNESMHLFPSSAFLREEAEKTAASIAKMEQSHVMTHWRLSERGRFHE